MSRSGFFSRRKLSGRELPEGELSLWRSCSEGTVRGESSGGEFTYNRSKGEERIKKIHGSPLILMLGKRLKTNTNWGEGEPQCNYIQVGALRRGRGKVTS